MMLRLSSNSAKMEDCKYPILSVETQEWLHLRSNCQDPEGKVKMKYYIFEKHKTFGRKK